MTHKKDGPRSPDKTGIEDIERLAAKGGNAVPAVGHAAIFCYI
jgi:hypothetical protein